METLASVSFLSLKLVRNTTGGFGESCDHCVLKCSPGACNAARHSMFNGEPCQKERGQRQQHSNFGIQRISEVGGGLAPSSCVCSYSLKPGRHENLDR